MRWTATAAALLIVATSGPKLEAATGVDWSAQVERVAPAIVSLRITLETEREGSGDEPEETTDEVRGTVVDPSGLILVWNSEISAGRMSEIFSRAGEGAMRINVEPTDIRVRLPAEAEERPAFLAASDSDLDLAFVQLEQPPAKPLASVDFSRAAKVALGDELVVVSRLSSAFDHAPYFDLVRITGEVQKPRTAWIVAGGNATQVGMPYFAADGLPAGVLVTVLSRSGVPRSLNPSKLFAELISLGRGQHEVGPIGLFLLPAERVRPVIQLAKERAAELLAERSAAAAKP